MYVVNNRHKGAQPGTLASHPAVTGSILRISKTDSLHVAEIN